MVLGFQEPQSTSEDGSSGLTSNFRADLGFGYTSDLLNSPKEIVGTEINLLFNEKKIN